MQGEFHSYPEQITHPEFITHLEIDYLEEQAVHPEQVSFSEFFPVDEMKNSQSMPEEGRRRPFWWFWRVLARIIVILCALILFAVILLRYPVHVTFRLLDVQPYSATLQLRMTVLEDSSSDIICQITDYNEGISVAVSTLLEGENPIFLQNLEADTIYRISILRDGTRIRSFLFNTLPAMGLPAEEPLPQLPDETPLIEEPAPEENAGESGEDLPAEESDPDEDADEEAGEESTPPPAPPVIIIIPADDPAATGPVNPLAISGVFGGDAGAWSIVVNLLNTDTGGDWAPTDQDEGVVMIDWQLRDDQGNITSSGTSSYDEMMRQFGIPMPGNIPSGNYVVDVQVNFVNTDNITTPLDNLDSGYVRDSHIQSRPTNLPTDVTITQSDNTAALELIYQYLWEKADADEGVMNGGYWLLIDSSNRLLIDRGSIDSSQLGQEIPVTLTDDVTTLGIYFYPQYENQGMLFEVDESAAYTEITLPDTGQSFRLFLIPSDSENTPVEPTESGGEAPSGEDPVSAGQPPSGEDNPATGETIPGETIPGETIPGVTTDPEAPAVSTEQTSSESVTGSAEDPPDPNNTSTE